MTGKISVEDVSNTNRIGTNLNYSLDYAYHAGTHRAERIGNRYYDYDLNGNLIAEREGGHAVTGSGGYLPYGREGDIYTADTGFGLVKPGNNADDQAYRRDYRWNERNLLSQSRDSQYTVQYRYGADGQRTLKYVTNSGRTTVYFNKMWQISDAQAEWLQSKHIYMGEQRLATKYNSEGNDNTGAELRRVYYYHSDHLGSAQVVTNYAGQIHERLEYTPYGELWIDWRSAEAREDATPFRFTGQELDTETGLYYYGARYLDPKTSRWLSGDPALGDYLPVAPVDDEAKKRNGNLPGQGGVFNLVNLHVYHYAGNNPVKYVDPDGEKVTNKTDHAIYVVYEDPKNIGGGKQQFGQLLAPGEAYEGRVDGVITNDGTIRKISDSESSSFDPIDIEVTQDKKGKYHFDSGIGGNIKNFLGDVLKQIKGRKDSSKTYPPEEIQGSPVRSWMEAAIKEVGLPSTWDQKAEKQQE